MFYLYQGTKHVNNIKFSPLILNYNLERRLDCGTHLYEKYSPSGSPSLSVINDYKSKFSIPVGFQEDSAKYFSDLLKSDLVCPHSIHLGTLTFDEMIISNKVQAIQCATGGISVVGLKTHADSRIDESIYSHFYRDSVDDPSSFDFIKETRTFCFYYFLKKHITYFIIIFRIN